MFGFYNGDEAVAPPAYAEPLLRRFFDYHFWATGLLFDRCARLTEDQLALSAPGTYGSLLETCLHIVEADRRYLTRLLGQGPVGKLAGQSLPAAQEEWRRLRERWTGYLDSGPDYEAMIECSDGWYPAWVLVTQAIHHGNDHRTHLGTVLLHHQLDKLEPDVWAYGETEGVLRELA
jgi:uncharacterized damage-inducible protein DinB